MMAFQYADHELGMDAAAAAANPGFGAGVVGSGWEREKAAIAAHPLYERLLEAHVACLRVATPVDQLPRIDAQIAARPPPMAAAAAAAAVGGAQSGDEELDLFMTHYVLLLCSFKEQLQQHVRVHAMEAVMACWELEQTLQSLTGASPGEGTGATMSDDEDNQVDSESNMFDGNDGSDGMCFSPLMLTEGEQSLVERVRQELKHEHKEGYREKLVDIREEIMRKRRAGKLPGDTASTLKAWWQAHSKWPYPTDEDKTRLAQETGLQLKQINNWFINQRKRNWHNNLASSSSDKSKRKRYGTVKLQETFLYKLGIFQFSISCILNAWNEETLQVMATLNSLGSTRLEKLYVNNTSIVKSSGIFIAPETNIQSGVS